MEYSPERKRRGWGGCTAARQAVTDSIFHLEHYVIIGPAIKPDIRNHGFTQIEDTDRHRFIRKVFKSFVFIRVYLCPSVVKNFFAGVINGNFKRNLKGN